MYAKPVIYLVFMVGAVFQPVAAEPEKAETPILKSQVMPKADVKKSPDSWGVFYPYFTGQTVGTRDMLAGVADIKPGEEIHPPHTHAEEEFLLVTKGQGIWHLNGEDFPAKAGDMLYAAPWDIHGIKNTGTDNLEFVVWKWASKGVQPSHAPDR